MYKLEPQGRIVAATFFPAVQYLLGIRAGQPVHFPLFRVEYLSDIRAGLFVHFPLFRVCTTSPPFAPVHILQSVISPHSFRSLHFPPCRVPSAYLHHSQRNLSNIRAGAQSCIFRVGKSQPELNDISTPWLSCNDNGNEHLKDTLCSCLSIFSDFSVPYFQL